MCRFCIHLYITVRYTSPGFHTIFLYEIWWPVGGFVIAGSWNCSEGWGGGEGRSNMPPAGPQKLQSIYKPDNKGRAGGRGTPILLKMS